MTYKINDVFTLDEEYTERVNFCNENGYYIEEIESLEDGTRQFTIKEPAKLTLDECLKEKLHEVSWKSECFEQSKCDKMFVDSSLGFRVNADRRSQQNIEGLIKVLGENKTRFKDYDNNFHELGVEDLQILLVECIQNGLYLYEQKFQMQEILNNMTDIEELKNFEIEYKMLDFNG